MRSHPEALKQFNIGDRVRIVKKIADYDNGWFNSWTPVMDEAIGLEGIITEKDCTGVGLDFNASHLNQKFRCLGWPAQGLELVAGEVITVLHSETAKIKLEEYDTTT